MEVLVREDLDTVEISIDDVGRVFFFEGRVIRGINHDYVSHVVEMIEGGFLNEIVQKGFFPKTWVSDVKIEGFALVVEHEKLEYWNYPYEWSFDMLKDAALMVLELNAIAGKYNLEIVDSHAFNVVYTDGRPVYIDFGSFKPLQGQNWKSYVIFYKHFYMPLYLWSKGYSQVARNIYLMRDYFSDKEFLRIKYYPVSFFIRDFLCFFMDAVKRVAISDDATITSKIKGPVKRKLALVVKGALSSFFYSKKFVARVSRLKKAREKTLWSEYHNNVKVETNARFVRIKDIIDGFDDAISLLELASNQGAFASYIYDCTHIEYVTATDYDSQAVNVMYLNNKRKKGFTTLLFDMVRSNGRGCDERIQSRLKSDVVVALALTHHLILTQGVSVDYILETMSGLCNKYIVIEFMPMGLYSGDESKVPDVPDYYTSDWFFKSFEKYFDVLLDERLEKNRHLFVGALKV